MKEHDEIESQRAEVERLTSYNVALVRECDTLRNSAPKCSGSCHPEAGPVEDCPMHGRSISEVWELVTGVSEYGSHWRRRAEAAEAERDEARAQVARLRELRRTVRKRHTTQGMAHWSEIDAALDGAGPSGGDRDR